jgi:hypothetical protein
MDKENGNRKRSTKGESRYRKSTTGKVKGQKEKRKRKELPGEIITVVKLRIKEKRQEKGEEERCIAKKFI